MVCVWWLWRAVPRVFCVVWCRVPVVCVYGFAVIMACALCVLVFRVLPGCRVPSVRVCERGCCVWCVVCVGVLRCGLCSVCTLCVLCGVRVLYRCIVVCRGTVCCIAPYWPIVQCHTVACRDCVCCLVCRHVGDGLSDGLGDMCVVVDVDDAVVVVVGVVAAVVARCSC